jgi:periplasmic protein TonB
MIARATAWFESAWFEDADPRDLRRWAIAAAIVVAVHVAAICAYLYVHHPDELGDDSSPISVDLAPSDDTVDQAEVAPTPDLQQQIEQPPPPPPPPPEPEAVVTPEPPPPQKVEQQPPPTPAMVARTKGGMQREMASWQSNLIKQLEKFKRYPNDARARGDEGTVELGFTLDRSGHVLAHQIVRSSGHSALDAEAIAMVERAQPLPPIPDSMPDAQLDLTVPIVFSLH